MRKSFSPAFTIVELLIVIVVIGILAALSIVSYNGITQRAVSASLQSDTENAAKLIGNYMATEGRYPATLAGVVSDTANTKYQYTYNATDKTFCVTSTTPQSTTLSYYFDSTVGRVTAGLCTGHVIPGTPPPVEWSMIAGGTGHFCGIYTGKVYCWGSNSWGQLGNNAVGVHSSVPVSPTTTGVLSGKTIVSVATGAAYTCVVDSEGKVYCWGYNSMGQLGTGDRVNSAVPVAVNMSGVLSGKTVTAISAGNYHACALAGGQVYCWGTGVQGQLGQGANSDSNNPVAVTTSGVLSGKTVAKLISGGNHSCVMTTDSNVYCWGFGVNGQIGNGSGGNPNTPVAIDVSGVLAGKTVTSISSVATASHTCVIASGAAYCWGDGGSGRLGNNDTATSYSPVAVSTSGVLSGKTMASIAVGKEHTCALDSTGKAYCWGSNSWGEIAVGSNSPSQTAVPIAVDVSGVLSGKALTGLTGAENGTCGYVGTTVYCWGYNYYTQLGNGTSVSKSNSPVLVTNP